MKEKLINYFFEDVEEYEAYKPYIQGLLIVGSVSLILTFILKIFL